MKNIITLLLMLIVGMLILIACSKSKYELEEVQQFILKKGKETNISKDMVRSIGLGDETIDNVKELEGESFHVHYAQAFTYKDSALILFICLNDDTTEWKMYFTQKDGILRRAIILNPHRQISVPNNYPYLTFEDEKIFWKEYIKK
jgi:hypothetical protein